MMTSSIDSTSKSNNSAEEKGTEFHERMLHETYAMAHRAIESGKDFDDGKLKEFEEIKRTGKIDIGKLRAVYHSLSKSIQPATPASATYLYDRAKGSQNFLGNVPPVTSHMLLLTLFFVVGFIVISGVCGVDGDLVKKTFLDRYGSEQFLVSALLVFSAGIGACFFNLYKMYDYIIKGIFDPQYLASYWLRLALGIVAGYILAEMIPASYLSQSSMGKPLLAFLGGFSADAVNWILQRLVETLKTMVKGSTDSVIKNQEAVNKALADVELKKRNLEVTTELLTLKNELITSSNLAPEGVKLLDDLIKKLK